MPFLPAEPTIDRLERYWSVVSEIQDAATVKEAPAPEPERKAPSQAVTLADVADEHAAGQPPPIAQLLFDVQRLMAAMWSAGKYREVARVVMVNQDGTDVTAEQVGKLKPSEVGRAIVPFSQELNLSWSTLQGTGSGVV